MELRREGETVPRSNTRSNVEVAILQTFDESLEKVRDFVMAYKLYLKIRIRKAMVEEQIQ